ncbi:MAG: zinc ribbon domain-containing protein [Peptococcaceae bacterium]|nr:MAG: zinc ribbon domain-containing protein [Peptococcaceae bacterium]
MPIFEFRCLECGNLFEKLFIASHDEVDIKCPGCRSGSFERVISRTNHVIGAGKGGQKPKLSTKSCSRGSSCTTLEIPGPGE